AAGNLTQDRAARKLAYDAQGRLQSVSLDGQQVAEYRYNALGQRIVKLTPESVTTYLYGPDGQLLGEAEHDGSGRKLRAQYYLWLDSLPLVTIDADYDAQGKVGNPTLLYLHGDHLDTPRLATDASGQIAWQWQSDAFGRGEALSQGSTQVNLRFPGQYYDAESGLHYNYFRDYDPETGRYVESDPIGLAGGFNTFAYVGGNPLSFADTLGLHPGDKLFGLPKAFWKWFHKQGDMNDLKGPNGQVSKEIAEDYHREWLNNGKPSPDSKGRSSPINEILDSIPPLILPPGFEEACEINPTMFGCPKPKIPMC
ncbi:TPA: RHS repeat domain-containing protein, partial [Pseudomonas aeruginosa]